jgi:dTDP-4-dehydrorhamnose 3,5-epimerase
MGVPTTQFKGVKTEIPGLMIFDVSKVTDGRGYFQEKFHKAKFVEAGGPESFIPVQTNISYNKLAGAIRGYHAEPWDKYISVVVGKVFCAYLDIRQGETFGKTVTVDLTPEIAVYLPRGVANSFQTIEADTYYIYQANEHWSEGAYKQQYFVNLADPTLKVEWPIPLSESVMSDRDRNHPMLSEINPLRTATLAGNS